MRTTEGDPQEAPAGVFQPPVAALVDALHATQPLRVWSLIMTAFGDLVAPRGGEIWAGTLAELLAGMGIDATAVRAALSRLARDGWLDRVKVGRLSYYRLSREGRATFDPALARVYRADATEEDPDLRLIVLPDTDERAAMRDAALKIGYGVLGPSVLIGTASSPPLPEIVAGGGIVLAADILDGAPADLIARGFDLAPLADRYRAFLHDFQPLEDALTVGLAPSEREAVVARVLLIHAYRRLVLRDPMLPSAVLPADWPGLPARALTARLYARLSMGADHWVRRHGQCRAGRLPSAGDLEARRFSN